MTYKSRKQLRKKCLGGEIAAAGIIAAVNAAMSAANVAAQSSAAKQQADAMRDSARQQAQAQVQASTLQANAIKAQTENNKELMNSQIETMKSTNESQNDIFKDMNMNMAMLAGQQNYEERKDQAKIKAKYGTSIRKHNSRKPIILQDKNFLIPIDDDGAFLLRGGSPNKPEDQTHDNSHKNTKSGKYNKGSFIKIKGRPIEAEAGGNQTPGEIIDINNDIIFSQRPLYPDGTSPVERILSGEPKEQVAIEQEMLKQMQGITDSGNRAKYGFRRRLGARDERIFQKWWSKNAPQGSNPDNYSIDYRDYFANNNIGSARKLYKTGGTLKDFFKSDAGKTSMLNAGANLLGAGINAIGNNIYGNIMSGAYADAANIRNQAYAQRADIYNKAYNSMTGINVDDIFKDNKLNPALAIASVRSGRFNINPQLTQNERNYQAEINASKNIGSAAARNALLAQAGVRRTDNDMKLYAEQANRVEQTNQGNITELNKMANENADRRMKSVESQAAVRLDALKYNNDINNFKIQGIADANSDKVMSIASESAQERLNNGNLRGSVGSNMLSGFTNALNSSIGNFANNYQTLRNEQNSRIIAGMASTNPNAYAATILTLASNGTSVSDTEINQAIALSTNEEVKNKLRQLLSK
uniref:DNA pilot protein n=1 Tax=Geladintestivirus 1 TaxID=3233133 RepID=A0AAU8MJU9_9CAUD